MLDVVECKDELMKWKKNTKKKKPKAKQNKLTLKKPQEVIKTKTSKFRKLKIKQRKENIKLKEMEKSTSQLSKKRKADEGKYDQGMRRMNTEQENEGTDSQKKTRKRNLLTAIPFILRTRVPSSTSFSVRSISILLENGKETVMPKSSLTGGGGRY